ncbi:MAG: hypothetical protein ACD_2C00180G0007 [uncultured bacterium (gcode 4)]|uniref:Uncharacterized protein n=1 Tax=uncultured bacterium (gcode 4) TaxID=1234023 RepID=K2GG84_9BACT|nr:MAG: hypothetical protein ACD_2C00180G0007 [uncultured bacterium (gcode 4)]
MEQSVIDKALALSQEELKTNPEYQKAVKEGNLELKKKIEEETIRNMTIMKAQSLFNDMQMQVDRKIDEILDSSLAKTSDKLISPEQKSKVKELFKEELYKYFVDSKWSELENTYNSVKLSWAKAEFLMAQSLRWNKILESEIEDILINVNKRLKDEIVYHWINLLKQTIFKEFNSL